MDRWTLVLAAMRNNMVWQTRWCLSAAEIDSTVLILQSVTLSLNPHIQLGGQNIQLHAQNVHVAGRGGIADIRSQAAMHFATRLNRNMNVHSRGGFLAMDGLRVGDTRMHAADSFGGAVIRGASRHDQSIHLRAGHSMSLQGAHMSVGSMARARSVTAKGMDSIVIGSTDKLAGDKAAVSLESGKMQLAGVGVRGMSLQWQEGEVERGSRAALVAPKIVFGARTSTTRIQTRNLHLFAQHFATRAGPYLMETSLPYLNTRPSLTTPTMYPGSNINYLNYV